MACVGSELARAVAVLGVVVVLEAVDSVVEATLVAVSKLAVVGGVALEASEVLAVVGEVTVLVSTGVVRSTA